jgi:hypothetical protein
MCNQEDFRTGRFCGKTHTRKAVDRWSTPTPRTKYKADGICLGAYVTIPAPVWSGGSYVVVSEPAQVWARSSEGKGCWWVATGRDFLLMHESQMTLVGHADQNALLEGVA